MWSARVVGIGLVAMITAGSVLLARRTGERHESQP
jgi:hypothetical protein